MVAEESTKPDKLDESRFFGWFNVLVHPGNVVAMVLLIGLATIGINLTGFWWEKMYFTLLIIPVASFLVATPTPLSVIRSRVDGNHAPIFSLPIILAVVVRLAITLMCSIEDLHEWWANWQMTMLPRMAMWVVGGLASGTFPHTRRAAIFLFFWPLVGGALISIAMFVRMGDLRVLTTFAPIWSLAFPASFVGSRALAANIVLPMWLKSQQLERQLSSTSLLVV